MTTTTTLTTTGMHVAGRRVRPSAGLHLSTTSDAFAPWPPGPPM